MHRTLFIARKELYHILRDPRSLVVIFAMPVLMTFLYGFAIDLDIDRVTLAVVDYDHSAESRALTDALYRSTYFDMPKAEVDISDPERTLRRREAAGILIVRPGFGEQLRRGEHVSLGVTVDGSDNLLAAAVQAYTKAAVAQYYQGAAGPDLKPTGIAVSTQVMYNPDLKSAHFFVPAIVAIILIMISALLTSVTIAREKETGTMEQLLVAPVRARDILLGKIVPYIVIAFIDGMLVLLFAKLTFGVPFTGSALTLALFTVVYVSAALAIGILISSIVATQQVAMMLALVTTMLPSVMLSGFIFAIKNMPLPLQVISHLIPARYYIYATRAVLLKGADLTVLMPQLGGIVAIMVVLMFVAVKKFKTRIG